MSDETVTLTIELPFRTLVGCGQLLKRQGQDPQSISIEQLVESTINSMMPWFEKKQWIEPVQPGDEKLVFVAMFGDQVPGISDDEPNLEIDIPGKPTDGFAVAEDVEAAVQAKLREKALESTKRDTSPSVVPDVQRPGKIDLFKVNRMDISVLSMVSPKDNLIDKVTKGIGDTVFRAAVEIVYTSLSPELWGTKTAEQAVQDMIQRHEVSNVL